MVEAEKGSNAPTPLTVRDYPWGCIYTGTRIQIIAAGIIPLKAWPAFPKERPTFKGRWPIGGRVRKVTVEKDYCPTDLTPGEVWVHYTEEERSPHESVNQAVQKLSQLHAEILEIVSGITPAPLSALLGIAATNADNEIV